MIQGNHFKLAYSICIVRRTAMQKEIIKSPYIDTNKDVRVEKSMNLFKVIVATYFLELNESKPACLKDSKKWMTVKLILY